MHTRRHHRRLTSTDAELAASARAGDCLALETLLGRYRHFAQAKSRKYFLAGGDADDVEQEALIGLFKAARDFRPDHLVSFGAFAEVCITRQIITAMRTASRMKHRPLNEYRSISGSKPSSERFDQAVDDVLPVDTSGDPLDRVIAHERIHAIATRAAERLSSFEVEVLRLYVQGTPYEEIAATLERRPKSVDNAIQRIKSKLDQRATVRVAAGARADLPLTA